MQSFQKKKKAKLFNREDANHIWVSPGITVRPNWNEGCGGYQKRISGIIDQAIAIHFPEVILEDILSRLPVKSLLRFKCVSKFWETLISEPYFKMKHLSCAKIDQDSRKLLTIQMCSKNRMFSMYCCPLSPIQLVEDVHKLSFPSNPTVSHCIIHCCMMHSTLFLWNPSTRESAVLPSTKFQWGSVSCYGLGYDSTSGGYKIFQHYQGCSIPGEILTLKGGSWRRIDEHPRGIDNRFICRQFLAFVHAAFHWISYSGYHAVAVSSFSISNEVYGEIPFPEEMSPLKAFIGITELEGMLCVHSNSLFPGKRTIKLWVLKEYGIKESWIPFLSVEDPTNAISIPKYRFADGQVLFWCSEGAMFRTRCCGPFGALHPCDSICDGHVFTEISPVFGVQCHMEQRFLCTKNLIVIQ
uniref:F-box domain-containing protein n=1 Tax=Solanum lycopersicum TaxID=4081 RepID=A0A3Q7IRV9_SOLLC